MLKKILSLTIFLSLLGASAIVNAEEVQSDKSNTNIQEESAEKQIFIAGKTYTYKNAPEEVKKEYEENCKSINKVPKDEDEIFIESSNHDIYEAIPRARSLEGYNIRWTYDGIIYVSGARNYSVNTNNTYVGYGYNVSGDSVHCLQLLLDLYANKDGLDSIVVDGIFGPNTHNLLLRFQAAKGLSQDGIAGPNTWNTLVAYVIRGL